MHPAVLYHTEQATKTRREILRVAVATTEASDAPSSTVSLDGRTLASRKGLSHGQPDEALPGITTLRTAVLSALSAGEQSLDGLHGQK